MSTRSPKGSGNGLWWFPCTAAPSRCVLHRSTAMHRSSSLPSITHSSSNIVTSCKVWRQVEESFKAPKRCTTVSWTFHCFYAKALLEHEKYKMNNLELPSTDAASTEPPHSVKQISQS